MIKLTKEQNGWVGTEDGRYVFHITKNGMTIAVKGSLSKEYKEVTIYDLEVLKEAINLYEKKLDAKGDK